MRVFVNVPQSAADDLLSGNAQASIAVGGAASRHYEGKVSRTSQAINPQSRTLRVEVDIPNADSRLVPGMYVDPSASRFRRRHCRSDRNPRLRSLTTRMW